MLIVRPLDFADVQALERLAVNAGGRMTTLTANRDQLSELIGATRQSLRKPVKRPARESYHFALEQNGELVGIAGIEAAVGISHPFYSYRIDEVVHASSELQIHNRVPALHLCQDYTGSSRLYTLFIAEPQRSPAALHLLSRARMLFMAAFPQRFAARTLVELQGVTDREGRSPFWECLGRHFFRMDFEQANYLTGINNKGFIADLMPHYPVYVPLLPAAVQDILGEPRPDVEAVMALLEDEGFSYRNYVDIFDAGPTLEARTDQIRTLRTSRTARLQIGEPAPQAGWALLSNERLEGYRCILSRCDLDNARIGANDAAALELERGDPIRLMPVNAEDIGRTIDPERAITP